MPDSRPANLRSLSPHFPPPFFLPVIKSQSGTDRNGALPQTDLTSLLRLKTEPKRRVFDRFLDKGRDRKSGSTETHHGRIGRRYYAIGDDMRGNGTDGVNRRATGTAGRGPAAPAAATDHSAQPAAALTRGSSSSSNAVAPIPTPSNQNQGDIPPPAAASGPGPGPVRRQKKRAQVSKACQRCRRLQKGCSESRPCQRCIGVGLEDQCLRSEMMIECHQSGSRHGAQHSQPQTQTQTHVVLPRSHAHPGLVPATSTASAGATTATATWSFTQLPASPESLVNYPLVGGGAASASSPHQAQQHHLQPIINNPLPKPVLDHCIPRFFSRLYPTIPILTPSYIDHLLHISSSSSDNGSAEAQTLLTTLCALVLLQIEHPTTYLFTSIGIPHSNSVYGRLLFDQAQASHHRALALGATQTQKRFAPTLERVLITFFLYACHAVLFHHSQAFFWLREASTLWVVLRVDDPQSPDRGAGGEGGGWGGTDGGRGRGGEREGGMVDMARVRRTLADRLFWVLLVSERSHAIRYRRPITLQITPSTPSLDFCIDPEFAGLASLVALFRPLDTGFMALLNQEVTMTSSASGSPAMVAGPLDVVEKSIAEAVPGPSLGPGSGSGSVSGPGSGPVMGTVSLPSMSPDGHLVDSMSVPPAAGPGPSLLPTSHLHTTQIANLKITQLWLRVILWQIRLRIGLLIPPPPPPAPHPSPAPSAAPNGTVKESLTYHHPLSIGRSLVQVTKSLPLESIRVHGVGLTEKVFDVACAMVDVLARVPLEDRRFGSSSGPVGTVLMTTREMERQEERERERHLQEEEEKEDLEWIRELIHRLPGGSAIYDELLGKHIAAAGVLPGLVVRAFEE